MQTKRFLVAMAFVLAGAGCGEDSSGPGTPTPPPIVTPTPSPTPAPTPTPTPQPIVDVNQSSPIATFTNPWAVKVLPDERFLVTQRSDPGGMLIVTATGGVTTVTGLPGNIGLLDVVLAPDFATSRVIYFSYMVRDPSAPRIGRGKDDATLFPERMMAARATLTEAGGTASLSGLTEIFRQIPAIVALRGSGEPGGRFAFSPDGRYLFLTSGDRFEIDKDLLFDLDNNLGKIIRLFADGTVPADNPFVSTPAARPEIWSFGHRNPYGLAFAPDGRLWSSEMGPKGGDELNLILTNRNYGWPAVSNGSHYDDTPIPDHSAGDGFEAPKLSWTPVISPAGMLFYKGSEFADWRGDILLTGLTSMALIRVRLSGETGLEVQRIDMKARIRDIAEGADGSLWIVTDGASGQLVRITPKF